MERNKINNVQLMYLFIYIIIGVLANVKPHVSFVICIITMTCVARSTVMLKIFRDRQDNGNAVLLEMKRRNVCH